MGTPQRLNQLLVAMLIIVGISAPTIPLGAVAFQDDEFPPTTETFYDEPDPAYTDTTFDDTTYNDPCDPAFHPDPASDPYCNPNATYDDSFVDPGETDVIDYCDPEFYPGWADDPVCNPGVGGFDDSISTTIPNASPVSAANRFAPALESQPFDEVPLTEIDPSEAPVVGAGRMLLAIDAIAELGGFERAITPAGATLLRDIREGILAAGLDEDGYTLELEDFVNDFIPFLESLEDAGVAVSPNLWAAAEDLEDVIFGEFDPATADASDLGLLEPRPWIEGLADLLVRSGQAPAALTPEADELAIRELLAAFAEEPEPTTTTTTAVAAQEDEAPPSVLALQDDIDTAQPAAESASLFLALAAAGALALGMVVFFLLRRRSRAAHDNERRKTQQATSRTTAATTPEPADPKVSATAKASVTELLDASRRMSASLDPATIATIALDEAKRIVGAEGGIVVRRTEEGLDPVGCEPPMLFNYDGITQGCLPRVIETGQATAVIAHDDPLLVEVPMAVGAVPIVADGVITGAILVVRVSAKPFDRDELDALEMLAPLVGSAFAVADTHGIAVDVEPLTGLQNRRRLDIDLASISTDDAVAYVMVDIDHFKNFNDTNGHAAGDEALRQVSALLQASVRPNDLVYRYGGEEFCVLLPGTTAAEAAVVAERARAAVEQAQIPGMENQPTGVVTISVGISDSAFGSPTDLVERADAALYESKRNGRNQVTLSAN